MQKVIRSEFPAHTIIAVAHRLDTILDFDRVLVMENGVIVEMGNPQELLKEPGPGIPPSRFRQLLLDSSHTSKLDKTSDKREIELLETDIDISRASVENQTLFNNAILRSSEEVGGARLANDINFALPQSLGDIFSNHLHLAEMQKEVSRHHAPQHEQTAQEHVSPEISETPDSKSPKLAQPVQSSTTAANIPEEPPSLDNIFSATLGELHRIRSTRTATHGSSYSSGKSSKGRVGSNSASSSSSKVPGGRSGSGSGDDIIEIDEMQQPKRVVEQQSLENIFSSTLETMSTYTSSRSNGSVSVSGSGAGGKGKGKEVDRS